MVSWRENRCYKSKAIIRSVWTSRGLLMSRKPRRFGFLLSGVFAFVGAWLLAKGIGIAIVIILFGASILVLGISLIRPDSLNKPLWVWMKLAEYLGLIISPVILAIIYFLSFVPVGIMRRLFGSDPLTLKRRTGVNTYWVSRDNSLESRSLRDQY